jgi:hypothetical protein
MPATCNLQRVTLPALTVSLLHNEDGAEDGDQGHNRGKRKGQLVAPCPVKNQARRICPESPAQKMNGVDHAGKDSNVPKTVEASRKHRSEGGRDELRETEEEGVYVQGGNTLIFQYEKKEREAQQKRNDNGDF